MDSGNMNNIPLCVRYDMDLPLAVQGSQQMVRFDAVNGNNFVMDGGSNEIRINISSAGFLVGSESYLHFIIKNGDANNNVRLSGGNAGNVFDSLRIESNGNELERIDGYNLINSILKRYDSYSVEDGYSTFEGGSNLPTDPTTDGGYIAKATSAGFVLRLKSGFLGGGKYKKAIPLIGTGGLTLILRLSTKSEALEANTATDFAAATRATSYTGAVTIQEPRLYCPVFKINDAGFAQRYTSILQQSGIEWDGVTYKRYQSNLSGATGQSTLQLNDRSISLRGFVTAIRPVASQVIGQNSFNTTLTNVTQIKYMISGLDILNGGIQYSPSDQGRLMIENIKLLSNMSEPHILYDQETMSSQGTAAVSLLKYGHHANVSMTGLNTSSSTLPSTVEITMGAGTSTDSVVTYSVCDAIYRLDSNGSFSSMY